MKIKIDMIYDNTKDNNKLIQLYVSCIIEL